METEKLNTKNEEMIYGFHVQETLRKRLDQMPEEFILEVAFANDEEGAEES